MPATSHGRAAAPRNILDKLANAQAAVTPSQDGGSRKRERPDDSVTYADYKKRKDSICASDAMPIQNGSKRTTSGEVPSMVRRSIYEASKDTLSDAVVEPIPPLRTSSEAASMPDFFTKPGYSTKISYCHLAALEALLLETQSEKAQLQSHNLDLSSTNDGLHMQLSERALQLEERDTELGKQRREHEQDLMEKDKFWNARLRKSSTFYERQLEKNEQIHEQELRERDAQLGQRDLRLDETNRTLREQRRIHAQQLEERDLQLKEQARIKQSMMLDLLTAKDTTKTTVETLTRDKHRLQADVKKQTQEATELTAKLDSLTANYSRTFVDMNTHLRMSRQEVDHLEALNKTMEEDLDELRTIENEDAAQRERRTQGLPPAYGSLDDEDQLPPHQLHKEDGGPFDADTLERTVNAEFTRHLLNCQTRAKTLRASANPKDKAKADVTIFYCLSIALMQCCRLMNVALEGAQNICSFRAANLAALSQPSGEQESSTLRGMRESSWRSTARREYMAARIANLILHLSWRLVGACEMRPVTLRLTSRDKAKLGLAYKDADDGLLEALRGAFAADDDSGIANDRRSRKARRVQKLFEYQSYLTQVDALRNRLTGLGAGVSYPYYSQTTAWLGQNVDSERFHQANPVPTVINFETQTHTGGVNESGAEVTQESFTPAPVIIDLVL